MDAFHTRTGFGRPTKIEIGNSNRWHERLLTVGVVILVALASSLAMSPSVADPDLWGHVQFGRDTIQHGLAGTTTYSYTAEGFRWINHENLSEITMAWVVDTWGPAGLLWGKFCLSLFVICTIIYCNLRRGVGLVPTSVLTLLVAWNLGYHWSFRPQLASFVLFTLLMLLFQFCFYDWRDQWCLPWSLGRRTLGTARPTIRQSWLQGRGLWLAVPIIVVWTNSHGGFAAGVCIAVAYLMLRAVEAICVRGHEGWGLVRRMTLISAAIIVATLINPYSYHLMTWLVQALGVPRPEIVDWSNGQLWTIVGLKFWMLLAIAIWALVASRKSHDFVQLVILAIVVWQSISHFRHVPFFAILCGFWLGPHLQSAMIRWQAVGPARSLAPEGIFVRWAACISILAMLGVVSVRLADRLSVVRVDRNVFPVDALNFLQANDIHGRLVVTFNWAQYALAARCGHESDNRGTSRIGFDGRFRTCYPQQVIDMHFDFLYGEQDQVPRYRGPESPPLDPYRVLEHGNPDVVLIKRFDEVSSLHIRQKSDQWSLLYQDGLAQVWGRASRFDYLDSTHYLSADRRRISDALPRGYVAWPALPSADGGRAGLSKAVAFKQFD